jgi:CDP-paratose 2-epimerase
VKILVTGACGFVGSTLLRGWIERGAPHVLYGIDNFVRPGSEQNRASLARAGVRVRHADIRCASDFETLPAADVVIDAAANPSVLAGVDGVTSSRQLVEHNLSGTVNMLEYCRRHRACFILLSTSRVYSIAPLSTLPMRTREDAFEPDPTGALPPGISERGVAESFSTTPPVSLYGCTKLASEQLALEYGDTFGFPVWLNRCGVLAGAGQFGRPDQGIFAYWVNAWLRRRPLRYIGFGGHGYQARDCLHPLDLLPLLEEQMTARAAGQRKIVNVGGGRASARSLCQLSDWCGARFGDHLVESSPESRPFDIPWMVLDASCAEQIWGWRPTRTTDEILEEISRHAEQHPDWLELSADN